MSTGQTPQGIQKLRQVAAKAADDETYRQRLLSDPAGVLQEVGLTVPTGANVVVHENTEDEIHLVLPTAQPEDLDVNETDVRALSASVHF